MSVPLQARKTLWLYPQIPIRVHPVLPYDPAVGASDGVVAIHRRKAALRDAMRRVRADIAPPERRRLAAAVERRIVRLPQLASARTVMVFASFGSEIPTDRIIEALAEAGHKVLLPVVERGAVHAVPYRPGEPLVDTKYGPLEPAAGSPVDPGQIDMVITPGLAFDRNGARLGYGRAYYDRYLARLSPPAVRVGIAFHQQLVAEVPATADDERVDLVVTDREVVVTDRGVMVTDPGQSSTQ